VKTPQDMLKMSTVRPDRSRETATPLTDGCNNNRLVQLSLTVSVSLLQDAVKLILLQGFVGNSTAVVS